MIIDDLPNLLMHVMRWKLLLHQLHSESGITLIGSVTKGFVVQKRKGTSGTSCDLDRGEPNQLGVSDGLAPFGRRCHGWYSSICAMQTPGVKPWTGQEQGTNVQTLQ